jgi:hypothetical protein
MFKEELIKTDSGFIIRITAENIRKYVFEKKEVYRKNVLELIPEKIRDQVVCVKRPEKLVSNYQSNKFLLTAEWVFETLPLEVKEEIKKTPSRKTPTRKPRRTQARKKTTSK